MEEKLLLLLGVVVETVEEVVVVVVVILMAFPTLPLASVSGECCFMDDFCVGDNTGTLCGAADAFMEDMADLGVIVDVFMEDMADLGVTVDVFMEDMADLGVVDVFTDDVADLEVTDILEDALEVDNEDDDFGGAFFTLAEALMSSRRSEVGSGWRSTRSCPLLGDLPDNDVVAVVVGDVRGVVVVVGDVRGVVVVLADGEPCWLLCFPFVVITVTEKTITFMYEFIDLRNSLALNFSSIHSL